MIGTSQLINTFSRPCFTDTTDIFKDGSGVALYGLDYDASDTGGASGKFGEAAIFNGSSSNISIPTLGGSFYDNDFSISLWVNLNSLGGGSTAYLFSGAGSRDVFINFNTVNSGGGISARLYDGTIRDVVYSSAVAGNWYHVVFVRSKTNGLNLYVDGISRDTNAFTGNAQALSFTSDGIGGRVQDRNTTDGRIDQVRIFNTALTSSQVTQLHQENNSTVGTHLFGCIANYNLDGSAKESMGTTAYDGTETDITYRYDGTPTAVDFGVGGKSNYGARFNGSSSRINLPIGLGDNGDRTRSMWIKINELPSSGSDFFFYVGNQNANDDYETLRINSSGNIQLQERSNASGSGDLSLTSSITLNANQWYHIVYVFSGTSRELYINNSTTNGATGTKSGGTVDNSSFAANLGAFRTISNTYDGSIDQVRLFSKALNQTEIDALYAETACTHVSTTDIVNYPAGTTPVAYYKLDNSSEDYSTGGNDGTDTNIEYRFGRFGQAAVFNGSSSLIAVGSPIPNTDTNVAISAWVKLSGGISSNMHITGTGITSAGSEAPFRATLQYQSANTFRIFALRQVAGTYYLAANSTLTDVTINADTWYHVVWSYNSTGRKLSTFLNGTAIDTDVSMSTSGSSVNDSSTVIGSFRSTSGPFFDGSLDQLRIYSTALSSSQVTQLYNEKPETDTSTFKTVLYEGNGGTNFVSNVGFEPDLVWVKARDDAHDHVLYDTVRVVGSGKALSSNATYAEGAYDAAYGFLDTFESTGFVAKTGSSFANYTNKNNESYVAWCWKAGGDAVSNTVGDITSTVSANQDAGFSIVKYTPPGGGSVYTNTVGHGLTSAPEIIIQKATGVAVDWYVHTSLIDGSNDYLVLNSSAAKGNVTQNFAVTSTTFTDWGWNGNEVVNYCFHSVSGVSKMGKYTGDGTTSGKIITTGFEPSFLLTKPVGPTGGYWYILDNRRSTTNPRNDALFPNDSLAEIESTNYNVDFLSNGFELKNNTIGYNTNNEDYIYMAFK